MLDGKTGRPRTIVDIEKCAGLGQKCEVTTVGPLLYAGVGDRLHFAGNTCYKFVGYMEGALNSGASIARRLAVRDGVTMHSR
jgi:hypothetical protein